MLCLAPLGEVAAWPLHIFTVSLSHSIALGQYGVLILHMTCS